MNDFYRQFNDISQRKIVESWESITRLMQRIFENKKNPKHNEWCFEKYLDICSLISLLLDINLKTAGSQSVHRQHTWDWSTKNELQFKEVIQNVNKQENHWKPQETHNKAINPSILSPEKCCPKITNKIQITIRCKYIWIYLSIYLSLIINFFINISKRIFKAFNSLGIKKKMKNFY